MKTETLEDGSIQISFPERMGVSTEVITNTKKETVLKVIEAGGESFIFSVKKVKNKYLATNKDSVTGEVMASATNQPSSFVVWEFEALFKFLREQKIYVKCGNIQLKFDEMYKLQNL